METKANYILIGAFTLFGILVGFGFLLWLAKVEVDRQYAYYDVLFDNVSGLSEAGDVRYNGLPVGQVVDLALDADDPSQVRVRLEVDADTPVKTDTVATLQSLGVTGVSFVGLSGGSPGADTMPEEGVIRSQTSALQSVLQGAPELLQKAVLLLEDINDVVNVDNRQAVDTILMNLSSASGRLDRTLADVETLSDDIGLAAREVAGFAGRLDALSDTAQTTLETATDTLAAAKGAVERSDAMIETANATLSTMDRTFAAANTLIDGDLTDFVRQGTATAASIETTLDALEPTMTDTLQAARGALTEAEQTFITTNRVLDEDIDAILTDARSAVNAFKTTVENASGDIGSISDEVLQASQSASRFMATLETVVTQNRRQLSNFLRVGLPEFLRLTEEARILVSDLDRFVEQAQRDPARFLLGTQGSEFRR
ncbi:MCE family protein [Roseobacter sp. YSTF-M11]|uniref:MCE family protein n=1 Tax=Roseobacter insulae TaxID=2859783 RepID=A0A9X1FX15_9RHOB|nr:MlaD family protein [Roseobacter insulae]MBW4709222.1 MCE family protein [Roseobacter insulae]